MRQLLNTLYVTTPEAYLALEGENVVIYKDKTQMARFPLHNLESIVTFGYTGASPGLMGACAERDINLCFMTKNGRFLARVTGAVRGNVLLRQAQYAINLHEEQKLTVARNFILGKLFNSKWVLERAIRDHGLRLDAERLKGISQQLSGLLTQVRQSEGLDVLRGYEGKGAAGYFSVFDELILNQKDDFYFRERNKRPPRDNVNALLSFVYSLLANEVAGALETVGLDPYMGFMHTERPGRPSLALDMMEELRPVLADRFVLSLVNRRQITGADFTQKENGAVIMNDEARKAVLAAWQNKKQEQITHPFLEEKMQWGLVPYAQAMLLARYIRQDLDEYPPFLWK